ncbi:MAG: O-antigen ligase family protein [Rhodospirillales bacterium]|nr:O-antigen ligase family protein [Rhodospirillales bacterium]
MADWLLTVAFFAVVALAALPMGANRDWAWAPIAVIIGLLAVAAAAGVGTRGGFEVIERERLPLLALTACFLMFILFGLFQMATWAPLSGSAWFYETAARLLGGAHAPVPDIAIDASRNALLKCLTCGAIFLMARALCRDRERARLLLLMFIAGALVVVGYGFLMQLQTNSCYVGSYLKKVGAYQMWSDRCLMSGTFVSSNSFGSYCGMALVAAMALVFAGRRRRGDTPYGYDEDDEESFVASLTGFRVTMLAACLLLLGGLLFSASRAGLAATLASGSVLAMLMLRGRWHSRPGLVRLFVGAAIAIGLVVLVIAGNTMVDKMVRASDGGDRIRIWLAALQAIRMSPWLGWGLGGFADIYAVLQPAALPVANDLAHSTPLETMVEVGVPMALVGYAIVLIPCGVAFYGALTRRRAHRYLPGGAFAVAVVPIVHSMVDFSLQMPAIAFVVSALLGMGWTQAFGRRERAPRDFTPWE